MQIHKAMKSLALKKLKNRLQSNGFKSINVHKILNNSKKVAAKEDGVFLQTGFINDRFNKKVNKILKQYSFPIKAIFKPNRKLSHCFRPKNIKQKHENCNICIRLPEKYNCDDRFIVYKFTCNLCQKFYIGETCRPLRFRYEEHKRSLEKNDKKSALSEHAVTDHPGASLVLLDFDLCILAKFRNPVETRIHEARQINNLRPPLNRKLEIAHW